MTLAWSDQFGAGGPARQAGRAFPISGCSYVAQIVAALPPPFTARSA
jgi:hypothetical protein